jgi:CheY-like chemotaxis protein
MALLVTAEDNDDVRTVMARALQRAGHTVIATPDGAEALAAAREHRPDAVITDVDMPIMTGLELSRAIREDTDLRHTPVVVVSGSIAPNDPRALDAGVTVIIGKPFTPAELLRRLDEVLAHPSQQHV